MPATIPIRCVLALADSTFVELKNLHNVHGWLLPTAIFFLFIAMTDMPFYLQTPLILLSKRPPRRTHLRSRRDSKKKRKKIFSILGTQAPSVLKTMSDRNSSRWWFASTACVRILKSDLNFSFLIFQPLIAGTFGPMANAFSICALVESWRVYIPPGGDESGGESIEDPKW
jgi:hypothetical protein